MNEYGRMYAKDYASHHHDAAAEHSVLTADGRAVRAAGAAAVHRIAGAYSGFTPAQVQHMSLGEKVAHAIAFGVPDLAKDLLDDVIGALLVAIPMYVVLHFTGIGEALDLILVGLAFVARVTAVTEILKFFSVAHAKNEGDLRAAGKHFANAVKNIGFGKLVGKVRGLSAKMARLKRFGTQKMITRQAGQRVGGLAETGYDSVVGQDDDNHHR